MVRGEGVYLYDDTGKAYLDAASGIATNVLGHQHPAMQRALHTQADQLWHCSNLFHNQPLQQFSRSLTQACFADQAFFCSSGTEAVECAIKTIRRYHYTQGQPQRHHILTAQGAFHGRTTGALAACSNEASKQGFAPLMSGFHPVAFHDIDAMRNAITADTAAIMLETIQGEGGVRVHDAAYLQAIRQLCDEHGLLLFLDEIQCGYGRTGQLFAFEEADITPDIVTVAKGIGGGFPLAAMLVTKRAGQGMTQGTHGSTYGSNPLACAVGQAVLDTLLEPSFFPHVQAMGTALMQMLESLATDYPHIIQQVRGRGLMLGLALEDHIDKHALSAALREAGLLVAPAVSHVIRVLPPLIIQPEHITLMDVCLRQVCKEIGHG